MSRYEAILHPDPYESLPFDFWVATLGTLTLAIYSHHWLTRVVTEIMTAAAGG